MGQGAKTLLQCSFWECPLAGQARATGCPPWPTSRDAHCPNCNGAPHSISGRTANATQDFRNITWDRGCIYPERIKFGAYKPPNPSSKLKTTNTYSLQTYSLQYLFPPILITSNTYSPRTFPFRVYESWTFSKIQHLVTKG